MPRFFDFHDDLKLPAEGIDEIAQETREGATDEFGVRQVELCHNSDRKVSCLLEGRTRTRSASTTRRSASRASMFTRVLKEGPLRPARPGPGKGRGAAQL